jgi:hypothetical protein
MLTPKYPRLIVIELGLRLIQRFVSATELRPVVQGIEAAASLRAPLGGHGLVLIQILTDWDAPIVI